MSTKDIAIVSRMTGAVRYGRYKFVGENGQATRVAGVVITGGSGTVDKYGRTSNSSVTMIDADQLELLESDPVFVRHVTGEYIGIVKGANENEIRAAVGDLQQDDSRQLEDSDFAETGPAEEGSEKATTAAAKRRGRPSNK